MSPARRQPWPALLDAMEERTRRLAAVLENGEGEEAVPDVVAVPDAPLPAEYVSRVRELLAETIRLERIAASRSATAATALHYAQA